MLDKLTEYRLDLGQLALFIGHDPALFQPCGVVDAETPVAIASQVAEDMPYEQRDSGGSLMCDNLLSHWLSPVCGMWWGPTVGPALI